MSRFFTLIGLWLNLGPRALIEAVSIHLRVMGAVAMSVSELVNLIVKKFGGNRVEFCYLCELGLSFRLGHNFYLVEILASNGGDAVVVSRMEIAAPVRLVKDNYSNWVCGILNGLVRNDAGELVRA